MTENHDDSNQCPDQRRNDTDQHRDGPDQRIVVDFTDTTDLQIETLDVGVADGVIAFDISGKIESVPDDQLDSLRGAQLEPAEISFIVAEAP